jgi:hypothetical protein
MALCLARIVPSSIPSVYWLWADSLLGSVDEQ